MCVLHLFSPACPRLFVLILLLLAMWNEMLAVVGEMFFLSLKSLLWPHIIPQSIKYDTIRCYKYMLFSFLYTCVRTCVCICLSHRCMAGQLCQCFAHCRRHDCILRCRVLCGLFRKDRNLSMKDNYWAVKKRGSRCFTDTCQDSGHSNRNWDKPSWQLVSDYNTQTGHI